MAFSGEFADHIGDLFAELGPVHIRRMFGAAGLYAADVLFAIATEDGIYIKVCAETESTFTEAGCEPFSYQTKNGRRVIPGLRRLPEAAMDDPAEASHWGRLGVHAALSRKAVQRPRKRAAPRDRAR